MKIRMLVEKTGPRHDVEHGHRAWPAPGGEIDVPDEEGAELCARGEAAPVAQKDKDVETRAEPKPAQGASKAAKPQASKRM